MRDVDSFSWSGLWEYFTRWWYVKLSSDAKRMIMVFFWYRSYQKFNQSIRMVERVMDAESWWIVTRAWMYGLCTKGFEGAHLAAAGLA